jgi:hypothetical protein
MIERGSGVEEDDGFCEEDPEHPDMAPILCAWYRVQTLQCRPGKSAVKFTVSQTKTVPLRGSILQEHVHALPKYPFGPLVSAAEDAISPNLFYTTIPRHDRQLPQPLSKDLEQTQRAAADNSPL